MQQSGFQFLGREEEAKAVAQEAEGVVTLLIRHLPEAIPHDTLSRLFSNYGAFSVRPCSAPQLRNCAFLDFKNEALAYQAFRQLNGLRFLAKVLSVERASNEPIVDTKLKKSEAHIPPTSTSMFKDATKHTILGSTLASEPIAPRLGVDYPFPPHLEYVYPPPDGNILTNIVNALIAVPRFYTQVLHLMNKMNIPAPFRMALPTPPLPPSVPAPPPPPPPPSVPAKPHLEDLSSGDSEMESSDEEIDGEAYLFGASTVKQFSRKRRKQEAIVGPAVDKDVAHEAVGLKPATLVPKEIPMIKKKNPVLQIKIAPKLIQNEHRDDTTSKELEEPDKEGLDFKPYATSEELESGKLPPEEILSLPMFKNYTAGNPTSVLYVKNLAKDVVADDFYFIFGSLFGSVDATKSSLSVKLMQEGRMRGQAFVTFPSVELAHRALCEDYMDIPLQYGGQTLHLSLLPLHLVCESSQWIRVQRQANDNPVWPESSSWQNKLELYFSCLAGKSMY
ncbi:U11/U12 small nuclear ribonucleoprotein 65 kDa protein isoform X1 [Carya illinoinensis]|uniref:U11/U12 small nuclear ribonucleoprotein 65 kDa protein isoform X1 n=2 Tax=Carya illinoinensis TaxID=32201 RepID=UPI001C720CC3|nr:U11/U12 small nuclear ribonucleoprotein 65 kDa protein isoform X1 [Carya illinoinensis]XP_042943979.1 U11/U12 small nuclear ribonucleoprotein 65 kDa protein isoform X1 [Carya illinoinensis]